MIRVTIEMLPGGDASKARPIGLIEIHNTGQGELDGKMDYRARLKKTPPFAGALRADWKTGRFIDDPEYIYCDVPGFDRVKRGSYDLIFRALVACGLGARNPAR